MDFAAAARELEGVEDARALTARLGELGLTAVATRAPVDLAELCAAREAVAYRSAAADSILAVNGLGCHPLAEHPERERWVGPVRAGAAACGFALTEAEAGSDVAAMQARAERRGDAYALSGRKTFISNAPIAEWFVTFAMTDGGPAAFVVARDDGLRVVDDVPLSVAHPIGSLELDGVVVPASRRVGGEGEGIRLAMATLDTFRASVAAAACGMAARALDEAVARVKVRRQFGRTLAELQLTQARLAECRTELEAARGLVRRACATRAKIDVAMAKLFATEAAQRIVDAAVQLHGGLGVVRGVKVEELYREVRSLRIYEGTSEIQKLIIAREMLR
ncbi:MAG TPA: acyl-CoA dehydrogenase family protein [Haliangiales bacterium]|nr:acyl-CoA dehydrogenase family protein [Haliangiales bacterium]